MSAARKPWVVAIHEWRCGPGAANHAGRVIRSAHIFPSRHAFDGFVQWATASGKTGRWTVIVDGDPRSMTGASETDWDLASEMVQFHADPLPGEQSNEGGG